MTQVDAQVDDVTPMAALIPSVCTPFDAADAIDLEALIRLTRFAVDAGASGVACLGLAGEPGELRRAERESCISAVVEAAGGRVPVVVGVSASDAGEAGALAVDAERRGASMIMLALTGTTASSVAKRGEQLVRVANAVAIPIMAQDAPGYTGATLGVEAVADAVGRAPNIHHLKIEGGARAIEVARLALGDRLSLWGGDGGRHLLDCLRAGASGVIPGVEIIDRLVSIVAAERAGDRHTADARLRAVLPWLVFAMESLPAYVACAKAALVRRGLLSDARVRLAGGELGPQTTALLERHLHHLGVGADMPAISGV